jgi:hypothetical protein
MLHYQKYALNVSRTLSGVPGNSRMFCPQRLPTSPTGQYGFLYTKQEVNQVCEVVSLHITKHGEGIAVIV